MKAVIEGSDGTQCHQQMVTILLIVPNQIESCARFSQRLVGASSKAFRDIYQVKSISFGEFLDSQWGWLGLCDFTAVAWVPGWGAKILQTVRHGQKTKYFSLNLEMTTCVHFFPQYFSLFHVNSTWWLRQ